MNTSDKLKGSVAADKDKQSPIGKGLLRKAFWLTLAIAVFWWLGSGGETTPFRKAVAILFGWQMDVVLAVLGAVVMILAGITVVFMTAQVMTVPRMKPLTDQSVIPAPAPAPRDGLEAEVQGLGFRYIGDFDADMCATSSMRIRAYVAPDMMHAAIIMDGKTGPEQVTILEFSSKFQPLGSVATNTSPYPRISSYPPEKFCVRAPWKKTAAKVFELHQALCRVAGEEKFALEAWTATAFAEEVITATRKDMEYQVLAGRYRKVGEDQYRMSLLGVVIAVPRLWLNMTYSFLFSWYRPPAGFFCRRLRRRLQMVRLEMKKKSGAPQSDDGDDDTPESAGKPISEREREAVSVKL